MKKMLFGAFALAMATACTNDNAVTETQDPQGEISPLRKEEAVLQKKSEMKCSQTILQQEPGQQILKTALRGLSRIKLWAEFWQTARWKFL